MGRLSRISVQRQQVQGEPTFSVLPGVLAVHYFGYAPFSHPEQPVAQVAEQSHTRALDFATFT
jgi:hypothetical protein